MAQNHFGNDEGRKRTDCCYGCGGQWPFGERMRKCGYQEVPSFLMQ